MRFSHSGTTPVITVMLLRQRELTIFLSLSLPESVMDTFKVVLTFESEDEIVWCDHTNETALALL